MIGSTELTPAEPRKDSARPIRELSCDNGYVEHAGSVHFL
jgi:hypothetical protein